MQRRGQKAASYRTPGTTGQDGQSNSITVLRELFALLEEYAPLWYTEELHNRAAAALGELVTQPALPGRLSIGSIASRFAGRPL